MSQVKTINVFTNRTTTGTSEIIQPWGTRRTIEATVTGTGAVSATVVVQISNDETNWLTLTTLTLSGTTTAFDGAAMDAATEGTSEEMSVAEVPAADASVEEVSYE